MVRAASKKGRAVIDSGGTRDEARQAMWDFFNEFADEDTFRITFDEYGVIEIYYRDNPSFTVFTPRPRQPVLPYRERVIEGRFKELTWALENGHFVIRSTFRQGKRSHFRSIPPEEIEAFIGKLRVHIDEIQTAEEALARPPVLILGKYSIPRYAMRDLVQPDTLIVRK
ncbi:MAG: hypothetical protein JSV33_09760 [bacterium]|nr:MAG: hypothetical protein JSV33_09760 [bacterium]